MDGKLIKITLMMVHKINPIVDKIINIPLDGRFATRIAFLNLARITPYNITSLPNQLLPRLKNWSSADSILNWSEN